MGSEMTDHTANFMRRKPGIDGYRQITAAAAAAWTTLEREIKPP